MLRIIDSITRAAALLAAWLFFAIGLMVTWEVIMRKIFNAPTIWSDELSRLLLVWAVYLAAAEVLKRRKLITVELFEHLLNKKTLRYFDLLALLVIFAFSAVVTWYGIDTVRDAIELGRKTSSILAIPKWITESSIPAGFGLLTIQAAAEGIKALSHREEVCP
jgi:TRAP-type C4-dicarboxylate transport system permease small subunit